MFHWTLPPSVTELTTADPQLNSTVSPRRDGAVQAVGMLGSLTPAQILPSKYDPTMEWLTNPHIHDPIQLWQVGGRQGAVVESRYSHLTTFESIQTPLEASLFKGEKHGLHVAY